ncbi:hypothetical protein ASF61_08555 [Duganella sp. Leaf126]|uniref:DUF1565 domain-containing protein n=1 Tax=Duganella sp. Leaf126 TaxID=1736266 RepID=UPI0006F329F3|nr:DUF1565 domain-containing protein [Duganella sp. Leaf126]KQQ36226.1 hypothetical protein ASF61_08555 [Duganella sp. Leaf126]
MKLSVNYLSQTSVAGAAACVVLLSACGGQGDAPGQPAAVTLAATTQQSDEAAGYDAAASALYVATTGSDSNPGTSGQPFRTIARAAQAATPGAVVHVAPGVYEGGFRTNASGTPTARIRYVSDSKWNARIVPPANSANAVAWDNRGSYVDIDGFEVDGSNHKAGTRWAVGLYTAGSFGTVSNSHVHHIGQGGCVSGGGIGADSYYKGVSNDVLANVVHDIGVSGCKTMSGVFVNSADSDVKNNLIYGVSQAGVQLWHDATRVAVSHNTIFAAQTGIVVGGGDPYTSSGVNDYSRVANNIVVDTEYGVVEQGNVGSNNKYTNNLMYQQTAYPYLLIKGVAVATIAAAPQFVNYVRSGGGDYQLQASSPAIDKGLASEAPPTDLNGKARPAGAGPDLGAYEFNGATPGPTPTPNPVPDTAPSTPNNLYVSTTGSDSNSGAQGSPLRTIARASALAKPNTTVHVAPGTYAGGFKTTASGTASGRIYYYSTTKWGAKIVPPASSSNNIAWDNRGSYVDIIGFEVDGSKPQGGTVWRSGLYTGGSYDVIRGNRVHHIANTLACNGSGASAIGVDSYYNGVKGDVINNVVHDIGPANCKYIQGIYVSTSGSVVGNVVYRVSEAAIHLWHDATNVIIANNTAVASGTGIVVGAGDFYHRSAPNDYTHVVNNIVYDNRYGISEQGSTGTHNTYRNNLVYQNSIYNISLKNGLQATGTVSADPQFVSYTRSGTPDLHLRSSSPAKGKGTTDHAPSTDIEGKPVVAPVTIGAYQ